MEISKSESHETGVFLESVSTDMKEQNNSFFPFIFQLLFLTL